MKTGSIIRTLVPIGAACLLATAAQAQMSDKPLTENWAPTEWGADDKVGAPNRTTPEIVLKAVALVKQGKTATLGKLYQAEVPFFGPRTYQMTSPGTPTDRALNTASRRPMGCPASVKNRSGLAALGAVSRPS